MDLFSKMLDSRKVIVTGPVDDMMADLVIAQLLYLDSIDKEKPIEMYINSPGGSASAGFAMYDTMRYIDAPVTTFCLGMAASAAALLFVAGDERYVLPNSKVMIHQPSSGFQGKEDEAEIWYKEFHQTREKYARLIAKHVGRSPEEVDADIRADFWLSAERAVEYGAADDIIPANEAKEKKLTEKFRKLTVASRAAGKAADVPGVKQLPVSTPRSVAAKRATAGAGKSLV